MNVWKNQNSQIARWINEVNEFTFEVKYRNGENMLHADALSRAPVENENVETIMSIKTRDEEVLMFQKTDKNALVKIKILN